jgi:hypothetical protein
MEQLATQLDELHLCQDKVMMKVLEADGNLKNLKLLLKYLTKTRKNIFIMCSL